MGGKPIVGEDGVRGPWVGGILKNMDLDSPVSQGLDIGVKFFQGLFLDLVQGPLVLVLVEVVDGSFLVKGKARGLYH